MRAAIEPTSFIVVAVFVVTILAVAYGLKTRKGSGINEHPGSGTDESTTISGAEGAADDTGGVEDRPEGDVLDQHGMK